MSSPVKKSTSSLIKGQSSLSSFFSNGRLSLAESSKPTSSPVAQKGGKVGPKEKPKSITKGAKDKNTSSRTPQEEFTGVPVQEIKEKVILQIAHSWIER